MISGRDYDVAGQAHHPTIVLVHGLRVTRKLWVPQMAALSDRYRLIAPDLPGHGSRRRERFRLDVAVRMLDALIEEPVLLVGLSLGGYVAAEFTARYPGKVGALVLAGCSAVPAEYSVIPYRLFALACSILNHEWLSWLDTRLWRAKYPPEIAGPVIEGGFYYDAVPDSVRAVRARDFLQGLRSYQRPVLILNGQRDYIFRKDEKLYNRTIPNARLFIIEKAGHLCNIDSPAKFNVLLREFAGLHMQN